ncbi:MFS transporter [Candidatus Purcelliella pentastirinorum]|nr:MFS transporter [Candidatus Purcelliella pentastirinorum]
MNNIEYRALFGLISILFLRVFGLFMLLPVLTIHGIEIHYATNKLVGIAVGIYGLIQSIFQIPFSFLSDKYGYKKFIIIGLIIFVIGNLIACYKNSIWNIIIGRAIQGLGAITSPSMALLSDLLDEKNRMKSLGFMGIVFGAGFSISMFLGPFIVNLFGIQSLFIIASFLGFLSILIAIFIVPCPNKHILNRDVSIVKTGIYKIFFNLNLFRLNFSIFCLHIILMFNFITFPILLNNFGFLKSNYWKLYFFMVIISFICSVPVIIYLESKRHTKIFFKITIVMLFVAEILLYFSINNFILSLLSMQLFFIFFNIKEFLLPFLLSYFAPIGYRGTAIGIFSTYQFFGSFLGSFFSGIILNNFNLKIVFFISCILIFFWFLLILHMKEPIFFTNIRFVLSKNVLNSKSFINFLINQPGIIEVLFFKKENTIHFKIDDKIINKISLKKIIINYLK